MATEEPKTIIQLLDEIIRDQSNSTAKQKTAERNANTAKRNADTAKNIFSSCGPKTEPKSQTGGTPERVKIFLQIFRNNLCKNVKVYPLASGHLPEPEPVNLNGTMKINAGTANDIKNLVNSGDLSELTEIDEIVNGHTNAMRNAVPPTREPLNEENTTIQALRVVLSKNPKSTATFSAVSKGFSNVFKKSNALIGEYGSIPKQLVTVSFIQYCQKIAQVIKEAFVNHPSLQNIYGVRVKLMHRNSTFNCRLTISKNAENIELVYSFYGPLIILTFKSTPLCTGESMVCKQLHREKNINFFKLMNVLTKKVDVSVNCVVETVEDRLRAVVFDSIIKRLKKQIIKIEPLTAKQKEFLGNLNVTLLRIYYNLPLFGTAASTAANNTYSQNPDQVSYVEPIVDVPVIADSEFMRRIVNYNQTLQIGNQNLFFTQFKNNALFLKPGPDRVLYQNMCKVWFEDFVNGKPIIQPVDYVFFVQKRLAAIKAAHSLATTKEKIINKLLLTQKPEISEVFVHDIVDKKIVIRTVVLAGVLTNHGAYFFVYYQIPSGNRFNLVFNSMVDLQVEHWEITDLNLEEYKKLSGEENTQSIPATFMLIAINIKTQSRRILTSTLPTSSTIDQLPVLGSICNYYNEKLKQVIKTAQDYSYDWGLYKIVHTQESNPERSSKINVPLIVPPIHELLKQYIPVYVYQANAKGIQQDIYLQKEKQTFKLIVKDKLIVLEPTEFKYFKYPVPNAYVNIFAIKNQLKKNENKKNNANNNAKYITNTITTLATNFATELENRNKIISDSSYDIVNDDVEIDIQWDDDDDIDIQWNDEYP
jgi:hypothetical protein